MLSAKNHKVKKILDAMQPFLANFGICRIALFGSYARDDDKQGSDIDIIIDTDKDFSIFSFIRLKQDLEDKLDRKIDLVESVCLDPVIREEVLSQALVIYEQK